MIKVFEAFAGYGSQAMALKRAGIPHEVVGISEIDKYAIQAYNAVHGDTMNYGDISKIDWSEVPDFDFFTYSFPCTDISNAGLQKGFAEGSGTRSGLLWECRKAIEVKRPKYLMMENVKALVSKKFMPDFLKWEEWLRQQGYTNFWQVLNAKDYGVPQNRERVFMISILGEAWYQFPEKFPLEKRLKDVLEEKVDEKYYLSNKLVKYVFSDGGRNNNIKGAIGVQDGSNPSLCITLNYYKTPRQGNYIIEPTLRIPQATKQGYVEVKPGLVFDASYPESKTRRGRVQDGGQVSPTLTAGGEPPCYYDMAFRIRKLTPRECFRLMGVSDADIDKIQAAGISNSQQYKMAGNSIVVDVLVALFNNLFF